MGPAAAAEPATRHTGWCGTADGAVNRAGSGSVSKVSKEADPVRSQTVGQMMTGGALVLLLAACGMGSGGDAGAASTPTGGGASAASTVSVKGGVLVDGKGRALYEADQESGGTLRCTGSCLNVWVPLLVTGKPKAGTGVSGTLGTVDRPGGRHQVTYDGTPVYAFAFDKSPGQVTGDGTKDSFGGQHFTWHAVRPGGGTSPASGGGSGSGGARGYNY
jgi:predicted lipoprotein with Yx(FWY)xxD motif